MGVWKEAQKTLGSIAAGNAVIVDNPGIADDLVRAATEAAKITGQKSPVALDVIQLAGSNPEAALEERASISRGLGAVDKVVSLGLKDPAILREAFINGANGAEKDDAVRTAILSAAEKGGDLTMANKGLMNIETKKFIS